MLAKPRSLTMWKAKAQASDTGWPVAATTSEASASTAGASAAMKTPMAILVISSGSRQCRPYQRQNISEPAIKAVETKASTASIQVMGMVWPKNTSWKFFSDQISVEDFLIAHQG